MKYLFLLGIFFANAVSAEQMTLKIGLAFRFEEAAQEKFINSFTQGFDLAKKQFMKANPDLNVELIRYDHNKTPSSIRAMAQKIARDDIHFVIGGESSDEVKVMAEVFEPAKVLLLSPTSSDPRITKGKNYIFRACFADDQTARALARFVIDELRAKGKPAVLGVLHNTGNSYTDFLTSTFNDEFTKLNRTSGKTQIKVVKREYSGDHFNFSELIKGFSQEGVGAVALFTGKDDFLQFVESAQKQKLNPIYYGSDGWGTNQSVIENLGKIHALSDFTGILNSYWNEESSRTEVKQFIADYKAMFNRTPDGWSAIAFDSAKILLQTIKKATTGLAPNSTEVASALKNSEFKGLVTTPKLKYDNSNSPKKTLYLYEISANRANFKAALE